SFFASLLPFVKAIGWNQASSAQKGFGKAVPIFESFGASIDDSRGLFAPRGNQSPIKRRQLTTSFGLSNGEDFLARSNIETRRRFEKVHSRGPKPDAFRMPKCESSAHKRSNQLSVISCQ